MAVRVYNLAEVKADLYGRITSNGEAELLLGDTTILDIPPSVWQYDTSSTATDNFAGGVIDPTSGGTGRWIRKYIMQPDWNNGTAVSTNFIANKPTVGSTTRTTSTQSLSLVGAGATGTQISGTKDSTVRFTVQTSATATIAGAATSTVTLKKCATNSATEGDWTTVSASETSQAYSLAVALQGVTGGKAQLITDLPAGWFVKLVNSGSGTHSETFLFGEKTIYG